MVDRPTDRQTNKRTAVICPPFFAGGHNKENKSSITCKSNPNKYQYSIYFLIQELCMVTNVYISKTEFLSIYQTSGQIQISQSMSPVQYGIDMYGPTRDSSQCFYLAIMVSTWQWHWEMDWFINNSVPLQLWWDSINIWFTIIAYPSHQTLAN